MQTLKIIYRLFKVVSMLYTIWKALMRGRFLAVGLALYRLLKTKRVDRDAKYVADFTFITAGEPAIYRRQGLRKLISRRIRT